MLIPRFSLRTTMKWVTACAFLFLVLGQAVRGEAWAVGITVVVLSLVITLAVHACFFALALLAMKWLGTEPSPAHTSRGGLRLSADDEILPDTPQEVLPRHRSEENGG